MEANRTDITEQTFVMNLLHQELTGSILKTFYSVVKQVGYGFDKTVYINAIAAELVQNQNIVVVNQTQNIVHCNTVVGQHSCWTTQLLDNLVLT